MLAEEEKLRARIATIIIFENFFYIFTIKTYVIVKRNLLYRNDKSYY